MTQYWNHIRRISVLGIHLEYRLSLLRLSPNQPWDRNWSPSSLLGDKLRNHNSCVVQLDHQQIQLPILNKLNFDYLYNSYLVLYQGSENIFCKGLVSEYFRLCKLEDLSQILKWSLWEKSNHIMCYWVSMVIFQNIIYKNSWWSGFDPEAILYQLLLCKVTYLKTRDMTSIINIT